MGRNFSQDHGVHCPSAPKAELATRSFAMSFCVLFGLLFCCLACFREGVWTKYTPQDVARWHTQGDRGRDAPTPPRPALARTVVSGSGDLREPAILSPRPLKAAASVLQEVA